MKDFSIDILLLLLAKDEEIQEKTGGGSGTEGTIIQCADTLQGNSYRIDHFGPGRKQRQSSYP